MSEYTLGISLGYNASCCIIDEKQNILYAASEERFTNKKNCKEFPLAAIKKGIDYLNIKPHEITNCAYCHYQEADLYDLYRHTYHIDEKLGKRPIEYEPGNAGRYALAEMQFIKQQLALIDIMPFTVQRINHHQAHATCAYALSPFHKNALYVVADGFGDGESITVWQEKFEDGEIFLEKIFSKPLRESIALVYQFVTGALGYKEHQHEGKITGLAGFGNPEVYLEEFEDLYTGFSNIKHDDSVRSPIIDFDIFSEMKRRTYALVKSWLKDLDDQAKFEKSKHIAAGVQAFAEKEITKIVTEVIKQNDLKDVNLILSGGLFANVTINRILHENISEVKNIFVAPPMGDEGTSIGAAFGDTLLSRKNYKMTNMTMRLGTEHEIEEIKNDKYRISKPIKSHQEVAKMIAKDLAENKIVCLFDGRMEFGPRALIGRSIMYNCRDKETNTWLNHQLGRTEYMPFAPFCKEEHVGELFKRVEGKEIALKNMTITVKCTDEFVKNYPAACHIDNTARPQVISKDENELAWAILDEYEKLTGEKALINTSFNLHNYPIIESVKTAIDSWSTSNTDSLYIGNNKGWVKISK